MQKVEKVFLEDHSHSSKSFATIPIVHSGLTTVPTLDKHQCSTILGKRANKNSTDFSVRHTQLMSKHNCKIRLLVELTDFLKIETEVNKGQCQ